MKRFSAEDRQEAHELLDALMNIAESVHPDNEECSVYRVAEAQRATRIYWHLYRLTLAWAEDIHLGHYLFEREPWAKERIDSFIAETGPNREDEDWFLEIVGGSLRPNSGIDELCDNGWLSDLLEHYVEYYDSSAADQHIMYEMTQTTNLFGTWVDLLHDATFQLLIGDQPKLFSVTHQRRGDAWRMHWAKRKVVGAILYLQGRGMSKREARETVGTKIGVSEPALKKWEIEIRKNGLVDFLCGAAEAAGEWSDAFNQHESLRAVKEWLGEDAPEQEIRYGLSFLDCAWSAYEEFREINFDELRGFVRSARKPRTDT